MDAGFKAKHSKKKSHTIVESMLLFVSASLHLLVGAFLFSVA